MDFPFYIPSTKETLDQETYLCALLLAVKQLELTQRVITHEMRMIREVRPALLISVRTVKQDNVDINSSLV